MNAISKLSPAEILLLRSGRAVELSALMKLTFLDLLMKDVLVVYKMQAQSHSKDPVRESDFIQVGKAFFNYNALPHEQIFLNPFLKNTSIRILLRHIIMMAFQNVNSKRWYIKRKVLPSLVNKGYCKSYWLNFIYAPFRRSVVGDVVLNEIEKEIASTKNLLESTAGNYPNRWLEDVVKLNGNIFLLNELNIPIVHEVGLVLSNGNLDSFNIEKEFYQNWFVWHVIYDGFDPLLDLAIRSLNASKSGCGSCGGSIGCSGCSGCGGCGG